MKGPAGYGELLSEDPEVCHGTNVETVGIAILVAFGTGPVT